MLFKILNLRIKENKNYFMKFPYLFKGCEPLSNNIVKRYFEYLGYSKGNDCLGKGSWG